MHLNRFLIFCLSCLLTVTHLKANDGWVTGIPVLMDFGIVETTEVASSHPSQEEDEDEDDDEDREKTLVCTLIGGNGDLENGPPYSHYPYENNPSEEEEDSDVTENIVFTPNFKAVTLADCRAFPPDTSGAIGPTQFIAFCNGRIRSFNKDTGQPDGVLNTTSSSFFGSVMPSGGGFSSDPRIRFDRFTGRWFLIILGIPSGTTPDNIMIAMSHDSTITSSTKWSFFNFYPYQLSPPRPASDFADFPTFGIDKNALYIGANMFGASFNCDVYVVRKEPLVSSDTLIVTAFRNLLGTNFQGPVTPQGVDNYDTNQTVGFILGTDSSNRGRLMLRLVQNPGGVPSLSPNIPIDVLLTNPPLDAPHKGNTAGDLDAIDTRLGSCHIRDNRLYTAHNLGVDSNGVSGGQITATGCRWYELDVSDPNNPSMIQAGTLFGPGSSFNDRRFYITPSVMTNGLHSMVLGCSTSGSNFFIDAAFARRFSFDKLGTLRGPTMYTHSTTSYNPSSNPGTGRGRRWGDYTQTTLDPLDNMTIWTIQQYCDATDSYGCQVLRIRAPAPSRSFTVNPSTIAKNQSNINLKIMNTGNKSAAFYDTPAGFEKHLKVTLGDVKVTSLHYIGPTEIDLVVSTVGSTTGAKDVVIINPDGQKATKKGALTVN